MIHNSIKTYTTSGTLTTEVWAASERQYSRRCFCRYIQSLPCPISLLVQLEFSADRTRSPVSLGVGLRVLQRKPYWCTPPCCIAPLTVLQSSRSSSVSSSVAMWYIAAPRLVAAQGFFVWTRHGAAGLPGSGFAGRPRRRLRRPASRAPCGPPPAGRRAGGAAHPAAAAPPASPQAPILDAATQRWGGPCLSTSGS